MGNPLHYYAYPYILFALGFLTKLDQFSAKLPATKILALILGAFTLNASVQFNHHFKTGAENRITRLEAEILIRKIEKELPGEESISVIGSYWNSYIIDALSDNFIAIPRKGEYIRDYRNLLEVQSNSYFVLIANDWLAEFPLQITEHAVELNQVKVYPSQGDIQYALYRRAGQQ